MSNVLQLADDIPSLTDLHCLCNTGSKNKKQGSSCCCCRSLQSGKMSKQQQMTMKDAGGKAYRKVEVVYHLSQPASSSSLSRLLDHHPHMIQVQFPSDRSGPCLRGMSVEVLAHKLPEPRNTVVIACFPTLDSSPLFSHAFRQGFYLLYSATLNNRSVFVAAEL
jgi:hypothetical protein